MKKITLFSLFLLAACASPRNMPNNSQVLAEHVGPIKIFGIGRYASNSMILTLIDAQSRYFTIETPIDTTLKIGAVYR